MQGVSSLLEVLHRYFKQDIIVVIILAAIPWLIRNCSKKQKIFFLGIFLGILLLFNTVTFGIMNKLGENETYYRLFWILPFGCVFAFLMIKLWEQLKNKWQKSAFLLVMGLGVFLYSNVKIEDWMPRDLYYLPEETLQLAELIEKDSQNALRAYVYDYSDLTYGIREYDANIMLVDDGVEGPYDSMFANNEGNVPGIIVCATAINNNIEYVYIEREKEDAQMSLLAGGASYVGETTNHKVYKFDLQKMSIPYNWTMYSQEKVEIFDLEFVHLDGSNILQHFLYDAEGNLSMVNENLERMNIELSGKEEYQVIDLGEYYICSINNKDGEVSSDVVEQFENLNKMKKPIVLLLASPLQVEQISISQITDQNMRQLQEDIVAENSMVSAIFVSGYDEVWRLRLENGIVQCGCTAYKNTVITVKGE